MDITTSEVRDFIRSNKLKPSDLFGLDDLTSDPMITSHIESESKSGKSDLWNQRQREKDEYDKKLATATEESKKKEDALTKERDEALQQVLKGQIPGMVKTIKEERKLGDSQKVFIDRTIKKFSPEKIEDLEKDLNSFFDEQIKEMKELGESVFGIETKDPDPPPKGDGNGEGKMSDAMSDMSLE